MALSQTKSAAITDAGLLNVYDTDPAGGMTPPPPPAQKNSSLLGDQPELQTPQKLLHTTAGTSYSQHRLFGGSGGGGRAPTATAFTGEAQTAGEAETAAAPTAIPAAGYDAFTIAPEDVPTVQAAQGTVSDEAIAQFQEQTLTERAVAAERDAAQEQAALTKEAAQYEISDGAYVDKVTGAVTDVAPTSEAEVAQREAILGQAAKDGDAAQILETLNYQAVQARQVKGTATGVRRLKWLRQLENFLQKLVQPSLKILKLLKLK